MTMPVTRSFDTYGAYREAVQALLASAARSLAIYDPDLSRSALERPQAAALLRALARHSPHPECIRILIRNRLFLEREAPALLRLATDFPDRVRIRAVEETHGLPDDCFMVADASDLVIRFHADRPRGRHATGTRTGAAPLLARFESLWPHDTPVRAAL